jgi:hypothetical protein
MPAAASDFMVRNRDWLSLRRCPDPHYNCGLTSKHLASLELDILFPGFVGFLLLHSMRFVSCPFVSCF